MKKQAIPTNLYNCLLWLFVFVAIFVKCYKIDSRSFSLDELYAVCAALEPDYHKFLQNWVLYDSNPPLYYFFLRFWLKIFPATEFWARFPSVIFVLLASCFFINGIRKRFHHGEWKSLLLLVGCSYSFLFFAQEARAYAMLLLFTVLQLLCFIDLLQPQEKNFRRKLWCFAVFSILSSYTHYTGILVSALLFGILIVCHYKRSSILKKLIAAVFISFAAGLLWLPYFWIILKIDKSFLIDQDFTIVKEIISMLFFGYSTIGKYASIAVLAALPLLVYFSWPQILKIRSAHSIILLLALFFVLIIALSPIIPYFYYYRHYIILVPVVLLAIAVLLSFVDLSKSAQNILIVAAIIIVVSEGATHYKSKREEWRQAVAYIIKSNGSQHSKVIVIGEPWEKTHLKYLQIDPGYLNLAIRKKTFYQYYFDRFDKKHQLELVVLRPDKEQIQNYINSELRQNNRIYLLSNGGEFSGNIKHLQLDKSISFAKKEFYVHDVYRFYFTEAILRL